MSELLNLRSVVLCCKGELISRLKLEPVIHLNRRIWLENHLAMMLQWKQAAVSALLVVSMATVVKSQLQCNYLILAPNTIRPGFPLTLSTTIYQTLYPDQTVNLQTIIYKGRDVVVQSTNMLQVGTSSITLNVPTNTVPGTDYTLYVRATGGLNFNDTKELIFNVDHFSIFVQSDKAIYQPGQTIQFRVMAIYPTLRPYRGPFAIYVLDANNNIIQQWLNRAPNKNGIVSERIPLSEHPVLGTWTIRVEAEGQRHEYTMKIDEYVLPKFEVTISLPPFFDLSFNEIPFTIEAKYTYGKPVEGTYELSIKQQYNNNNEIRRSKKTNGTSVLTVTRSNLLKSLKPSNQNFWNGELFAFRVNVTETLTGITQSSDVAQIAYTDYPIKVEFSDSVSRSSYKPGLQYQAYLTVTHQDGSPLTETERSRGLHLGYCLSTNCYNQPDQWTYLGQFNIAPNTGVVEVFIPTVSGTQQSLQIEAVYEGVLTLARGASIPEYGSRSNLRTQRLSSNQYRTVVTKSVSQARSNINQYIQVRSASPGALTIGSTATFIVEATTDPGLLTYQIVSRGNIIHTETLVNVSRNITIQRPITAEMSPKSKLLVFFVGEGAEVVLDSLEFVVNVVFDNPVTASFSRETAEPGDDVTFTVETTPSASVGILTVDRSVLLLADGNDITRPQVLESVGRFDTSASDRGGGYNPFIEPLWCFIPYYTRGEYAGEILRNAGILYITDGDIVEYDTYPDIFYDMPMFAMAEVGVADAALDGDATNRESGGNTPVAEKNIRKEFPETWLWVDQDADSMGRVSVSTQFPDTITEWVGTAISLDTTAGLGVTENAALATVFKKFFVSLNLPYSVVRGEKFVLGATVFNYQDSAITATVSLRSSNDYSSITISNSIEKEVEGGASKQVRIEANKGATVNFPLKPQKTGMIELVVLASSGLQQDAVRRYLRVEPEGVAQEYVGADLVDLSNYPNGYSKNFIINLPSDGLVRDSVRASITATGDIMGPTMSNLDQLLRLPTGCGEQTMIAFAPDVFVYKYLTETGQSNPTIEAKALDFMKKGYQRELTYQHANGGSFSAWGDRSGDEGSTWLTAFVVRSFLQASPYITIDAGNVERAINFLLQHQNNDGTFRASGRIVDRGIEGGVSSTETLTAYVAIAMHQASTSQLLSPSVRNSATSALANAIRYLEGRFNQLQDDKFAMAIVTYTLRLGGSTSASSFRARLDQLATVESDGTTRYWTDVDMQQTTPEDEVFWRYPYRGPPSAAIEMTGYALLAYLEEQDFSNSVAVARWLSQQRNSLGGYSSTQDTVLALLALTTYATHLNSEDKNLTMSITTSADPSYSNSFQINNSNSVVLHQFELPVTTGTITVQGSGQGSFLLSFILYYNLDEVISSGSFEISINIINEEKNSITLRACGRYTGGGEGTGMSIMEVGIPSGFYAIEDELTKAIEGHPLATQYEIVGQTTVIYFNEIPVTDVCITVMANRSQAVAESKPSIVRIYDYYQPGNQKVDSYHPTTLQRVTICDVCSDCCGPSGGGSPHVKPTVPLFLLVALTIVMTLATKYI